MSKQRPTRGATVDRGRPRGVSLVGRALREARAALPLTQVALAEALGCTVRTIQRAEAGRPVSVSFAEILAAALGLSTAAITRRSRAVVRAALDALGLSPPPVAEGFAERPALRKKVLATLCAGPPRPRTGASCVLIGDAGAGKTMIAADVARAAETLFPGGVVWIEGHACPDEESLGVLLQRIAMAVGIEDAATAPAANAPMEATLRLLSQRDTLIIIDGAQDLDDAVMHMLLRCPCLVTTRTASMSGLDGLEAIEVAPLHTIAVGRAATARVTPSHRLPRERARPTSHPANEPRRDPPPEPRRFDPPSVAVSDIDDLMELVLECVGRGPVEPAESTPALARLDAPTKTRLHGLLEEVRERLGSRSGRP